MSACFYNNHGVMNGVDAHTYITIGPKGIPVPVLFTPHFVGMGTAGPSTDPNKRTYKVVADGAPMIEAGFATTLIPHMPVTALPPHPAEALELMATMLTSSSTAILNISSVTGEGTPLATCVSGCFGANGNCGPGVGVVLNPSTVVTSPTAMDYAAAVFEFSVGAAVSAIGGDMVPNVGGPIVKAYVKEAIVKLLKLPLSVLGVGS